MMCILESISCITLWDSNYNEYSFSTVFFIYMHLKKPIKLDNYIKYVFITINYYKSITISHLNILSR